MEKLEKLESQLEELANVNDIPDEVLNEFAESTQDFFDSYVTARVEQKTLQEMQKQEEKNEEKKKTRRRRLGENVPENIVNLVQYAKDEYFKGNFQRAIGFAKEAIKINPNAPEPYDILSLISEEQNFPDVALTFLVKAAELSTDNVELWTECARISKELGRLNETTNYLKKAAKANTKDISALLELYHLLSEEYNDPRSLHWVLNELFKREPTNPQFANELSNQLYQSGKIQEALHTLKTNIEAQLAIGEPISIENANLLSSGYLDEGMNDEVIALDKLLDDAPPDFRINAAIALVRQKKFKEAHKEIETFVQLDPQVYSEVYHLVAEELIRAEQYREAANLLQRMQDGGIESRQDLAFCLNQIGEIDQAGDCLKSLIIDFPNLAEPPTTLFQMYKAAGRESEVIQWLEENSPNGAQSDDLVLKRATTAYENDDIDTFLELATPLLCRILFDVYRFQQLKLKSQAAEDILGFKRPDKMSCYMQKIMRYQRSSTLTSSKTSLGLNELSDDTVFSMATTCLMCLFQHNRSDEALVLGGLLVICREKLKKKETYDVLFIFSLIAFTLGNGSAACTVMRNILIEDNTNDVNWEFFNVFIQQTPEEETSVHKFLIRTLSRLPDCSPLKIMLGNHSQSTVWFDHAISQYLSAFNERPNEPLISLLLAAAYLSKAYVRTQLNTRKSVLCAYACIKKYCELRVNDYVAEADYNMGRFYQTLKMYPHAEKLYRKVLDSPVDYEAIVDQDDLEMIQKHNERFSLKRDAAFNLALIYQESDPQEARRIYRKYLTVI